MNANAQKNQSMEWVDLAMEAMDVAVTIIDRNGILLYYNPHAAKILDRKPDYIGTDIHSHHQKTDSNESIDRMLAEFEAGRRASFHYEAKPYGEVIRVTLTPIFKNGVFVGCVQTVRPET